MNWIKSKGYIFGIVFALVALTAISTHTSLTVASPASRAMYVWDSYDIVHKAAAQDTFFAFVDAPHGNIDFRPDVLFVFVEFETYSTDALKTFISRAHDKGMLVHAAAVGMDWAAETGSHKKGEAYCSNVAKFNDNAAHRQKMDGVQVFLPVHEMPDFYEKQELVYNEIKSVIETCQIATGGATTYEGLGLPFGLMVHAGWDMMFANGPIDFRKLIDMSDYISILTFAETKQDIRNHIISKIWHAESRRKPVYVAVNTENFAGNYHNVPEDITFFQEGTKKLEDELQLVFNEFHMVHQFRGFAINAYKGYSGMTNKPLDITAPTVATVSPQSSAAVDENITIEFSEKLDLSSIDPQSIIVQNAVGKRIAGEVEYNDDNQTITFIPTEGYSIGQQHTVTVKGGQKGILDAYGNPIESDFSWKVLVDKSSAADAPVAKADSPSYVVKKTQAVVLDGSHSYDPNDRPLKYSWRQIAGTPVRIINENEAIAQFLAPANVNDTLTFELVVGNGLSVSPKAFIDVIIQTTTTDSGDVLFPSESFLLNAYKDLTGKSTNTASWTRVAAMSKAGIVGEIMNTSDYRDEVIDEMFQLLLKRDADAQGRLVWRGRLADGMAFRDGLAQIVASQEYNRNHFSHDAYVRALYKDLLNRDADADGLDYWVQQLANGEKRAKVARHFIFSREFSTKYIQSLAVKYLGGEIANQEVTQLIDKLDAGTMTVHDIKAQFITSSGYKA